MYEDFNRRLPMFGLKSPFQDIFERSQFYIGKSKINLIGADKPNKFMGAGCDYAFFNEAMNIKQSIFDQVEMRCRKFWWMDYNPEFTRHWIYDKVCKRPDVGFLKTTFRDNPYLSEGEKKKILSYEPTTENIRNGTADEFMWKVFGLGERANRKGAVYTHWKLGKYPDNPEYEIMGLDFGYNNPSAAVLLGYKDKVMYSKEVLYETGLTNTDLIERLKDYKRFTLYCDSAEPDRIKEFKRAGFKAKASDKNVRLGIEKVKSTNWVIDENSLNLIDEVQDYRWKEDRDNNSEDLVIKDKDHLCDALRYSHFTHHKNPGVSKFTAY